MIIGFLLEQDNDLTMSEFLMGYLVLASCCQLMRLLSCVTIPWKPIGVKIHNAEAARSQRCARYLDEAHCDADNGQLWFTNIVHKLNAWKFPQHES